MKINIIAACMLLVLVIPFRAIACTADEIPGDVKRLGYWKFDTDATPELDCFVEHGALAAGLLIKELQPVPEGKILDESAHMKSEHVLWAVRSLYYMTGFQLRAGSASALRDMHLDESREYWLLFESGEKVNLFAVWPSRGSTYIAPTDIQVAIFNEWKSWYAKDGAKFHYEPHPYRVFDWYEGIGDHNDIDYQK